jgi:subtilisin family serine protease
LDSLQVAVRTPYGFFNALPGNGAQVMIGLSAWAWSNAEQSSRGTSKFDIMIYDGFFGLWPLAAGTWALQIENAGNDALAAECYIADEATTWSGGARFLEHVTDNGTIDFPATADSAITVASYSTRGIDFEGIGLQTGGLSGFSSRGRRIDGQAIMDIAAPGNLDVISALPKDDQSFGNSSPLGSYVSFGGTSAAGPHVAGVAALLLQAFPQAGHLEIQHALQEGAHTDTFTGEAPNDLWGYGKLDAVGALNWLKEQVQPADAP